MAHDLADARRLHNRLWGLPTWATHNPAPTPCSLGRADLPLLRHGYVAAAKTDGERATVVLGALERDPAVTYAVRFGRAGDTVRIGITASRVDGPGRLKGADPCEGTLLDCEWLADQRRLVVLDAMALCGYDVKHVCNLHRRLDAARAVVRAVKLRDTAGNSVEIVFKPFVSVDRLGTIDPRTNADGLIFMPLHGAVQTGRASTIFKWKWAHTVDLLFRDGSFWVGDGDKLCPCDDVVVAGNGADCVPETVYELSPDEDAARYTVTRARTDKVAPNQLDTVRAAVAHAREKLGHGELVRLLMA